MILIQNYPAFEHAISLEGKVEFPKEFLEKVESFIQRNSVAVDEKKRKVCCGKCLKAYSKKLANEMNLESGIQDFLEKEIKETEGHDGYFIDKEKLIKI